MRESRTLSSPSSSSSSDDDEEFFGRNNDAVAKRRAGKEWPKIASIESDAPGSISSTQESLNLHSSETNVEETDEQQEEQTTATSTHRATS